MVIFRNVVMSVKEPDTNVLWLNEGIIKYYTNGGWEPIKVTGGGGTDYGLATETQDGLMAASDKSTLNALSTKVQVLENEQGNILAKAIKYTDDALTWIDVTS